VSGDNLLASAQQPTAAHDESAGSWLAENVWHPFANGTGAVQVYNTFASKPVETYKDQPAKTFSLDWCVQNLSSTAGAIIPYVIAAKCAGGVMRAAGEGAEMQGFAGRFMASEAVAQVVGAGAYDFLKKPNQGETRVGNAAGSMLGFSVFAGGNMVLDKASPLIAGAVKKVAGDTLGSLAPKAVSALTKIGVGTVETAGKVAVGSLGGLSSYETSNRVASWQLGTPLETNWDGRFAAMASGGFINVALPAVTHAANKTLDFAVNSRPWGKGVPIDREIRNLGLDSDPDIVSLARQNLLARARKVEAPDAQTRANVAKNVVEYRDDFNAAQFAHEMKHLILAKQFEPQYKAVAQSVESNAPDAEQNFYNLRAAIESEARKTENQVNARRSNGTAAAVVDSPEALGNEIAANGRTYADMWHDEWQQFKNNPRSYRPPVEYSGTSTATNGGGGSAAERADTTAVRDTKSGTDTLATDKILPGSPEPLGASVSDAGINFAVESHGASRVSLLVYPDDKAPQPSAVIPLIRTGDVWHAFVEHAPEGTCYQYMVDGAYHPAVDGTRFNPNKALIDPYAKAVTGDTPNDGSDLGYDNTNGDNPDRHLTAGDVKDAHDMPKAIAVRDNFDWQNDKPPSIAMNDSIIYEMNLRAFTGKDPTLPETMRGTYRGLIQRIPYLRALGITAVELMPIFEFDKNDFPKLDPVTGEPLSDSWGYSTVAYQAPEGRFAADGHMGQQVNEFKELVRELHKNNIEVILDVVFNHTREGNQMGPTISFKGLDNNIYYMLVPDHPEYYVDHTGCGNTLNVNHPVVQKLILDTLRYWAQDMHVDGFRFDLATIFKYDVDGTQKEKTPIISAIENDPILSKMKLIAEPWGPEQYYLGHFSDIKWAEWNGNFRDVVRKFMKGDTDQVSVLADRIAGSPSMFDESKGRNSINLVDCHDGFTLEDLVEYNNKHNERNGEDNRDGSNDNFSWNSGWEGPLDKAPLSDMQKAQIEALRARQVKNLLSMLFLSRGTPMILYGDEVRRSQDGNNNTYCQDGINMLDWHLKDENADHLRFTQMMIQLRKQFGIGASRPEDFHWHGTEPDKPDWGGGSRFIAWELKPHDANGKSLYSAFNAYWEPLTVKLPPGRWRRVVDTNLPAGQDIVPLDQGTVLEGGSTYVIQPRTSIILAAD
jgi:glycogen operon protein